MIAIMNGFFFGPEWEEYAGATSGKSWMKRDSPMQRRGKNEKLYASMLNKQRKKTPPTKTKNHAREQCEMKVCINVRVSVRERREKRLFI